MTPPHPNSDQNTFWNDRPGQTWARLQGLLDIQHAEAAQLVLDHANLTPGEAVLDIGCGGGETTFQAAVRVGQNGRAVGLDISAPILAIANARISGEPQISFVHADAQTYTADAPFDVAMSRFGVMFFDDPVAGFTNIHAQLRPGGRICWITWAGPTHNLMFRISAEVTAAHLGPTPPPDPTAPGPMALQDVDRVTGLLVEAGFAQPAGKVIDGKLNMPQDAAVRLVTELGPAAARMREENATDAQRDAIVTDILARFAPYLSDGHYRLPARYVLYTATRP